MKRLFYFCIICLFLIPSTAFSASTNSVTIYILDPITNYRVLPDTSIPSAYISNQISIFTCPGEFNPATFVLKPDFPATITFEVQGFSWPSDSIDIRVVKCWQQRGDDIVPDYPTISELLPELLLKNNSLVYVKNNEDYVYLNGAYAQVSHTNWVYGSNTQVTLMDTVTLQPVSIPTNVNQQFWVTIHPPSDARAGDYSGDLVIKNNGISLTTISLKVTVLPFTLPDPDIDMSIYQSQWYSSSQPNGSLRHYRSLQQFTADFTNLKNHGITNPAIYQTFHSNQANFKLFMEKRNQVFGSPVIVYYIGEMLDPAWTPAEVTLRVIAFRDFMAKNYGVLPENIYWYGNDEQDMNSEVVRAQIKAVHNCGCKVFNALLRPRALAVADVLDLCILLGSPDREIINLYHSYGHKIGSYSNPQVGEEKPLTYRRNYGLLLWQYDIDVSMDYAYYDGGGFLWDDWSSGAPNYYKAHCFVYPTMDTATAAGGVIDTIQYEGFREGINDIRYIIKLLSIIQYAKNLGIDTSEATAFVSRLRTENLETLDLNAVRNQIINYILNFIGSPTVKTITVESPDGGESWMKGTNHTIHWSTTGDINTVKIDLYKNGVYQTTIITNTSNTRSCYWMITQSVGTGYKIRITDTSDITIYDESDMYFSISKAPSTIAVSSPNGGESWMKGTTRTIYWSSTGEIGRMKIDLYKNDIYYTTINPSTANSGSYSWAITQAVGTDYTIRITDTANTSSYDESNTYFSIIESTSKAITVSSPNGGESWIRGTIHTIRWSSVGDINNVKIDLYQNAVYASTIVPKTINNGYCSWTITQAPGTNYSIRVTDLSGNFVWDESDTCFSIPAFDGFSWGLRYNNYAFRIYETNPYANNVYCKWDWGDGNITEWLGPYSSSDVISTSYSWWQTGTYEVRLKLKDQYQTESDWSNPHIFRVYTVKSTVLFGRYTNMTADEKSITVESVNIWKIYAPPFEYYSITPGEKIMFLNQYKGIVHAKQFLIGLFDVLIA